MKKLSPFFFLPFIAVLALSTSGLKQQQRSDNKCSLKKIQRIASKTIAHPLVYGPPLVVAIGGILTAKSAIENPEVLVFQELRKL